MIHGKEFSILKSSLELLVMIWGPLRSNPFLQLKKLRSREGVTCLMSPARAWKSHAWELGEGTAHRRGLCPGWCPDQARGTQSVPRRYFCPSSGQNSTSRKPAGTVAVSTGPSKDSPESLLPDPGAGLGFHPLSFLPS